MNYLLRDYSILTKKKNLETLYVFPRFPVYAGCVNSPENKDNLLELSINICKDTGILQLKHLAPLEQVYLSPHNDAIGKTWEEHNEKFMEFIEKFSPKKILEIGGGSGKLATKCLEKNPNYDWTILDPNPLYKDEIKIRTIKKYFSPNLGIGHDFDAIIHSHVIEHNFDPEQFLIDLSVYLKPGGFQIFAFPNMEEWLLRKYLNCLNFEHTIFLTEEFIDALLRRIGFEILEKELFRLDHSIFYATRYTGKQNFVEFPNSYDKNKQIYTRFVEYYKNFVSELNTKLSNFSGKVYLFGAHMFSQYLLAFGLDENKICGILDNSPLKIGKRLYGTKFKVFHPDIIRNENTGVVLKVGSYRNEIVDQLKKINPSVTIFE